MNHQWVRIFIYMVIAGLMPGSALPAASHPCLPTLGLAASLMVNGCQVTDNQATMRHLQLAQAPPPVEATAPPALIVTAKPPQSFERTESERDLLLTILILLSTIIAVLILIGLAGLGVGYIILVRYVISRPLKEHTEKRHRTRGELTETLNQVLKNMDDLNQVLKNTDEVIIQKTTDLIKLLLKNLIPTSKEHTSNLQQILSKLEKLESGLKPSALSDLSAGSSILRENQSYTSTTLDSDQSSEPIKMTEMEQSSHLNGLSPPDKNPILAQRSDQSSIHELIADYNRMIHGPRQEKDTFKTKWHPQSATGNQNSVSIVQEQSEEIDFWVVQMQKEPCYVLVPAGSLFTTHLNTLFALGGEGARRTLGNFFKIESVKEQGNEPELREVAILTKSNDKLLLDQRGTVALPSSSSR